MAQETIVRHVPVNPCCEWFQKKESKLAQKLAKSEEGRNFLKKAIGILEVKVTNFEAEMEQLELARTKAEDNADKKVEELDHLEKEVSALRSEIASLKQKDCSENVADLQASVSDGEKEISVLKEQLEKERMRAENQQKIAETELKNANEALQTAKADSEREMKMNESTIRVSLESEISSLKSQITMLQEQTVSGAQDVILLQDCISNKEKEINQLHELLKIEKDRADSETSKAEEEKKKVEEKIVWAEKLIAENEREMEIKETAVRLPLENEIASLKSQIELLQQQAVSGVQDVNETAISERDTEINRLKELLQKEKKRADSEKKKAETEKCRADKLLADSERTLKEKEQAVCLSLGAEISALESQIHLLQQEIAVRDEKKEVNLYQALVSEKEAEINQLKKLAEKERTRAEFEKKKAEEGKKKLNESQKIAKTEKSRADEEKKLYDIEREKVEEARLQLEILRAEVHDLKANLESEALKVEQANKIFETEKHKVITERQRVDMEMAKADEQNKVLETTSREIVEERAHADSLSLQLEEDRVGIMKLQKEIAGASKMVFDCLHCEELLKKLKDVKQEAKREKERADLEMRKVEYQREKAKMEADRCLELSDELEDNRGKTEMLKKEMQELVFSGKLVDTVKRKNGNSNATNLKLLKKSLELERMQTKHAKQVASLEKDRNILLQQEIRRIKETFSGITDQLDILDKCSSDRNAGINDLEKNSNIPSKQGKKRKFLEEELCKVQHSGNELMKFSSPLDAYDTFKHCKQCTKPLLSSKECKSLCTVEYDGNRNRSLDAVELAEHMYREGKKRCRQIAENVSALQDMLECSIEKRFGETGALLPSINCANQEMKNAVSQEELAMQQLPMSDELKTHSHPTDSRPMSDVTRITHACNEETEDANTDYLGNFDEVEDGDYLKLLSLDNSLDEETYQVAIERPLSPTLPVIEPLSVGAHENNNNDHIDVVSPATDNLVKLPVTDTFRTCHVPLLPEKIGVTGFHEIMENNDMCHTSDPSNLGHSFTGYEGLNVLSGSKSQPACSLCYYVIFSDMTSNKSITKIISATRTCMAQCSMLPQTDHVVQVMSTLLKVKGLLSREMVCVFFSLLLQNLPEFTLENFKNLTDGGLVRSFELFAEHVHSVMDDLETRTIEELLNLDELLSLIEDFLIHRRVFIHRDVLSGSLPLCDPKIDIIVSGGDMLSFEAASDQQLISASVVLSSICLAVDHIGFVCETSYNLLKMRKIDSSTLAILHVFAYISGDKYFTNCDHSLSMTVLKSLVTVLEREISSTSVVRLGFPPCNNCPYAVSAIPMDEVVSLVIKKLHNSVLSSVSFEDLREATVYMNDEAVGSNEKREPSSVNGEISCVQCGKFDVPCCSHKARMSTPSKAVSCRSLLYLGDVLSLLELLASYMNWNWSFTNIVLKLLDILDSCGLKLVPAIVVLLGQLGRIGVDANGYDDTGVETLRGRLSSFLHRKATTVTELAFQIATVTALLGVVPLRFEELFKSNNELSEVVKDSGPADCIRNWFSLLSKEDQSLSIRLLSDNVASLRYG